MFPAYLLLLAGVPVHVVAARLGHADPVGDAPRLCPRAPQRVLDGLLGAMRTPRLVGNKGTDVVHPVCFTPPPGSLPGLDRSPAALAGLPRGMGEVIFPFLLVPFGEVGIGKSLALESDNALLGCESGDHVHSSLGPAQESRPVVTTSRMAQRERTPASQIRSFICEWPAGSDQSMTLVASLPGVYRRPDSPKVVRPRGSQRGPSAEDLADQLACPYLAGGWPASGAGRLRPGPWFLIGVSVEAPVSSATSRVR
jgi:hypothetical protein